MTTTDVVSSDDGCQLLMGLPRDHTPTGSRLRATAIVSAG